MCPSPWHSSAMPQCWTGFQLSDPTLTDFYRSPSVPPWAWLQTDQRLAAWVRQKSASLPFSVPQLLCLISVSVCRMQPEPSADPPEPGRSVCARGLPLAARLLREAVGCPQRLPFTGGCPAPPPASCFTFRAGRPSRQVH